MRDPEAYPPEERAAREKGVTYVKLDGEVGILGNGAGLVMSTLDVIALVGGRAGELLRPRRRRRRAGRGRRARGDHRRPAGEGDPLQHLRRDHALRRGRARDPPGARADDDRATRSSSASTARTRRRAGAAGRGRARRTSTSSRRCSTRRSAPCELASWPGMTDVWSERAQAYRESAGAPRGPGPRPDRRVGGRRGDGARRRHRRRARRAAAARGGLQVVTTDAAPGMQPDVVCRERGAAVRRRELRRRRLPARRAPLRRRAGGRPRDGPRRGPERCSSSTTCHGGEALEEAERSATPRTCATTRRRSGGRCSRTPACGVDDVRFSRHADRARAVARAGRLHRRGRRPGPRARRRPDRRRLDHARPDRAPAKGGS